MKVFLHICCGPCALYPLRVFEETGIEVTGFFYNPNIHPFMEYERRVKALEQVARIKQVEMVWQRAEYGLSRWFSYINGNVDTRYRCPLCYEMRLECVAKEASARGFEHFSTTLLYSKYQRHDLIRRIGQKKAQKYGIKFFYKDFRKGWKDGIEEAVALGIYRQPYCGCIFSEAERYEKRIKRLERRLGDKEVL